MLDGLTEPQIADLQADMKDVVFAPRSVVFQQGALSDTIFVISSGRVRLSIVSETGEEFSPNLVEKGGVIGLAAALLHRPRIVSASAVDKVHTKSLPIASVERQMLAAPLFARNIARLLAEFTVDHIARSGFLVLDSATSRLARILVKFSGADLLTRISREWWERHAHGCR
jgi:CRP-like cAMP-binding protein